MATFSNTLTFLNSSFLGLKLRKTAEFCCYFQWLIAVFGVFCPQKTVKSNFKNHDLIEHSQMKILSVFVLLYGSWSPSMTQKIRIFVILRTNPSLTVMSAGKIHRNSWKKNHPELVLPLKFWFLEFGCFEEQKKIGLITFRFQIGQIGTNSNFRA